MKTTLKKKKQRETKKSHTKPSHYVAIGASAGGLEAITELLINISPTLNMAFFYVQHLSPDYKSMLSSLLAKSTDMKVVEAKNGMQISSNFLYVIPPKKEMLIEDGHIKLIGKKHALTINLFFSSLAQKHKNKVVGVVLSGSATDGTEGLKTIKKNGGITIAQDASAEFLSMPNSAIAAGVVDFVLSPKDIADELKRISKLRVNGFASASKSKDEADIQAILQILHSKKNVDFSNYKMNTISRRIHRRLSENKIKNLKQYISLLKSRNEEVNNLYQDLFISVTSFFRDAAAFGYMKRTLLPRLLKNKTTGETLRIWVPGCASGEEAYTIAMLMFELQEEKKQLIPFQIFATDLSSKAIAKARGGVYTEADVKQLSAKRKKVFFTASKGKYRVTQAMRDVCIFSEHNILRDPAFSKLDLISCCNMLIYFDTFAQRKVISAFHFGLNDNGYLMLGRSETTGTAANLFSSAHKTIKVYSKKPGALPYGSQKEIFKPVYSLPIVKDRSVSANRSATDLSSAFDAELLVSHVPASTIINYNMEILQFRGATEAFFKFSGKATFNILKVVQPEISYELKNAIQQAIKTKRTVFKTNLELKKVKRNIPFSIEVRPFKLKEAEPMLMVVFKEREVLKIGSKGDSLRESNFSENKKINRLEEELTAIRAEMQMLTTEKESTIEELQSANEEIISSNEELRTVNEELETSKEEIEATNEELVSSNRELLKRNEEVETLNSFSEAVLSTIPDPMLTLSKTFQVLTANEQFLKTFRLIESEVINKSFFKILNKHWDVPELRLMLDTAIKRKSDSNRLELVTNFKRLGEKVLIFNARNLVQNVKSDQQILLIIEDVTEERGKEKEIKLKDQELLATQLDAQARIDAQKESNRYLENVFMHAPAAISMTKGPEHIFGMTNIIYQQLIGNRNVLGRSIREAFPEIEGQGFFELLDHVYNTGKSFIGNESLVYFDRGKGLEEAYFNFIYQATYDLNRKIDGVLIHAVEVTDQVNARKKVEASEAQFTTLADNIQNLAWMADDKGWIYWYNRRWYEYTGTEPKDMEGWGWQSVHDPEHLPGVLERWTESINSGKPFEMTFPIKGADGVFRQFLTRVNPVKDKDNKIIRWVGTNTDVHEQKEFSDRLEEAVADRIKELKETNRSLQNANIQLNSFNYISSHDLQEPLRKIKTFSKLLIAEESKSLSPVAADYLERMEETVNRMQQLLDDLLSYSRTNTTEKHFEKTKMNELVDDVKNDFKELIEEKKAKVEIGKLGTANVIKFQFRQVIQNLLGNSLKFSKAEVPPHIVVSSKIIQGDEVDQAHLSPEASYYNLTFQDNGIGFDPQYKNRIFEIFQRLHDKEEYQGTGIGLAIVKKIVENHNGVITAHGEPGRSARFDIYLPIED